MPDPERSCPGCEIARVATRLERLNDLRGLGIDAGDGVVLRVQGPDRALADGDVARGRGGLRERVDATLRVDRGDPVPERLHPAVATGRQGDDHRGDHSGEHEQSGRENGAAATPEPGRDTGSTDGRCGAQAEGPAGILDQLGAAPVPLVPFLRKPSLEHRVEGCVAGQRGRLLVHMRPQHLRLGIAPEGRRARQALVQHAGKRVAVGAPVDGLAADLLGRQVVERPHDPPRVGRGAADLLGDAKVGQVGVLILVQEHVRRLDVAVNQAAPVRRVQGVGDLSQHRQSTLRRKLPLALEHAPQVAALDEAHRQVELPVTLTRLVDRDHVRMVQRSGEPRLLQEPVPKTLILGELRSDHLQRHRAPQRQVRRPIHDAHATAADQRLHPVAGEHCARSERLKPEIHCRARTDRTTGRRARAGRPGDVDLPPYTAPHRNR